jgi:processing peptidase subunit beta
MQCFPHDVKRCVNILSDMLQNPLLKKELLEDEKDTIKTELEESNKDMQEVVIEAAHFNSYRDHYMGQPILGDIDNIYSITQDMVKEYHATHYVGKNLIVIGTGSVKHEEFVDMVSKEFGGLKYIKLFKFSKNTPPGLEKKNTDKPIYTPSIMFMRDEEFYNAGIGVFYDAPSWSHEDYYAFMLLERIIGQYQFDKNGQSNLNNPTKQYSSFEMNLAAFPDITRGHGIYSPYSDCGLFGTYIYGNQVFQRYMAYFGISHAPGFGIYLNQVEVYRARARLWQELLNIQSPTDVLQVIGPQIL